MNRYFYTDRQAAAWMAEKFGMRFDAYADNVVFKLGENAERSNQKFYLHPDSVKLLEPREGDQGFDETWNQLEFRGSRWRYDNGEIAHDRTTVKIDKRNGIAFMWPEAEA